MSQGLFIFLAVKWRAPLGSPYNAAIGTTAQKPQVVPKMAVLLR